MSRLREAAIAVIDRWDSQLWKDLPHTARYMHDLRTALDEPDRLETEYTAATLRINNDLLVIAALTAERDEYAKAADDMAAAHKVERDELSRLYENALKREYALHEAAKLALEAMELHGKSYPHMVKGYVIDAIEALKKAGVTP